MSVKAVYAHSNESQLEPKVAQEQHASAIEEVKKLLAWADGVRQGVAQVEPSAHENPEGVKAWARKVVSDLRDFADKIEQGK